MISLLHPSRGRAEQSFKNSQNWLQKSGAHPTQTEVIVSIDADDPQLTRYIELYGQENVLISDNSSVVEATNKAAQKAKGDILIYLSDDFDCPLDWWVSITKIAKDLPPIWLLKVDDCLQKFDVPVLTIPIMSRGLYERLRYFWNPLYKSMFCDVDLFWVCRKLGVLHNAEHLKFPHLHCSIGKSVRDQTYIRSEANWNQGQEVFNKRKAQGFPT